MVTNQIQLLSEGVLEQVAEPWRERLGLFTDASTLTSLSLHSIKGNTEADQKQPGLVLVVVQLLIKLKPRMMFPVVVAATNTFPKITSQKEYIFKTDLLTALVHGPGTPKTGMYVGEQLRGVRKESP